MKYSIIIPIYNKEKYISRLVQSLNNQNNKNFEVVFIEDCSTDSSLKKLKGENFKFKSKILVNEKNKGVSYSRNRGIKNSTGNYLIFLDSDDYFADNYISEVDKIINGKKMLIVKRYLIKSQKNEFNFDIISKYLREVGDQLYKIENLNKVLLKKTILGGSGEVVLRKDMIKGIKFEEKLSQFEDNDFYLKIIARNQLKEIYYLNKSLMFIDEVVSDSLTKKMLNLNDIELPIFFENNYLTSNTLFKKKIVCGWSYSTSRRLKYKERLAFFWKYKKIILCNMKVNKQSFLYILTLINIDPLVVKSKVKQKLNQI